MTITFGKHFSVKENIFRYPLKLNNIPTDFMQKSQNLPQIPRRWLKFGNGYKFWKTFFL